MHQLQYIISALYMSAEPLVGWDNPIFTIHLCGFICKTISTSENDKLKIDDLRKF